MNNPETQTIFGARHGTRTNKAKNIIEKTKKDAQYENHLPQTK
jgi:hypothetical protein